MLTSTFLPLATALGLALLHSLWVGAVLYVLVQALLPLLRRPAARHHLAYGALLATFAGFAYAFYYVYDPAPVCENLLVAGLSITQLGDLSPLETVQRVLPSFAPWLSAIYLFGLIPAVYFLLRDQRRVSVLRSAGISAIPPAWAARLGEELAHHPATRRVSCYLSDRAGEVMTLGFWSPVIVFPVALVNELTPEMARTILLHEIAHLRHYDHWLNYPQQFLRTFFFFHPAVHGLCRLIDREREHRCDDWVAARCQDRRTYATALVTVARSSHVPANHLVMSATKTPFSERIQRLFLGDDRRKDGKFVFPVLLFALLGLAHLGYDSLGADAGAVDCLEEQSKQAASLAPSPKPDPQTNLMAYRQSKLQRSADEPWAVTQPAIPLSPCRPALTVEDLPYIAAPEPPASTHPRALESYERALLKYHDIRQFSLSATSPATSPGEVLGLKTRTYTPCPSRKLATPAGSTTRKVPAATAKLPPKPQTLSSASRVSSNDLLNARFGQETKNIGYCINGKSATKAQVKALDTREIADINVIELKGRQAKSRCPGTDGLVVITTKS